MRKRDCSKYEKIQHARYSGGGSWLDEIAGYILLLRCDRMISSKESLEALRMYNAELNPRRRM